MSASSTYRCERCGRSIAKGEISAGAYRITRDGHLFCPACGGGSSDRPAPSRALHAAALSVSGVAVALAVWAILGRDPAPAVAPAAAPAPAAEAGSAARTAALIETLFDKERERREARERGLEERLVRLEHGLEELRARPVPVAEPARPEPRPDAPGAEFEARLAALEGGLDAIRVELTRRPVAPEDRPADPPSARIDDPILAGHVRDLFAEEASKRTTAAFALFEARDPRTAPALREALAIEDPIVQSLAARTLGELTDADSLPALEEAMVRSAHSMVRLSAVEAVGRFARASSAPRLVEALRDEEARVRIAAIEALRRSTGQDLGYSADAPEPVRIEAIGRWTEWLQSRR